jgi:hypothetical protein
MNISRYLNIKLCYCRIVKSPTLLSEHPVGDPTRCHPGRDIFPPPAKQLEETHMCFNLYSSAHEQATTHVDTLTMLIHNSPFFDNQIVVYYVWGMDTDIHAHGPCPPLPWLVVRYPAPWSPSSCLKRTHRRGGGS